jgi:hypothetical protein
MNVQPKLQKPCNGPMPAARRAPAGPRLFSTWEEPWPLDLEVEPWHP